MHTGWKGVINFGLGAVSGVLTLQYVDPGLFYWPCAIGSVIQMTVGLGQIRAYAYGSRD